MIPVDLILAADIITISLLFGNSFTQVAQLTQLVSSRSTLAAKFLVPSVYARIVQGVSTAPFETLLGAAVDALYFVHQRRVRMALYESDSLWRSLLYAHLGEQGCKYFGLALAILLCIDLRGCHCARCFPVMHIAKKHTLAPAASPTTSSSKMLCAA